MKKLVVIFFTFIMLATCGGFEFIYKTNNNVFLIKSFTNLDVNGDDSSDIYVALVDIIGNNNELPKYKLLVNSSKKESAKVINKDATASQFNIQYTVNYSLYNVYKDCKVYNIEITTVTSYNARSDGYSFGTTLSQKESAAQIINKNISKFLFSLESLPALNKCIK